MTKAYRTYTPTTKKAQPRERSTKQEGLQQPQLESKQSKKLTGVKGPSSINNLVSNQIKQIKELFSLWIKNTSSIEGNSISLVSYY